MTSLPAIPDPVEVDIDADDTCVAVLDLSRRCDNPEAICHSIIPSVKKVLDAARSSGAPVFFTVSFAARGTQEDTIAAGLARSAAEPIFYPDHFDKFSDPILIEHIRGLGLKRVIICGSSSNNCVMYSATSAARVHDLDVVIPVDCVNAKSQYQQEYALFQLTNLPGKPRTRSVTLSHSSLLTFVS